MGSVTLTDIATPNESTGRSPGTLVEFGVGTLLSGVSTATIALATTFSTSSTANFYVGGVVANYLASVGVVGADKTALALNLSAAPTTNAGRVYYSVVQDDPTPTV